MSFITKILVFTAYISIVHASALHHETSAKKFDEVMIQTRATCKTFDKKVYLGYAESMPGWRLRKLSDSQFNPALIKCISEYMCTYGRRIRDNHSVSTALHKAELTCDLSGDLPLESVSPLESSISVDDSSEEMISDEYVPAGASATLQISARDVAWLFIGLIAGVGAMYFKVNSHFAANTSSKALRRPEL